ncbi:hypothetical protein OG897_13755 [Streptomyces sp. NBC_00237]|uniref:hypothetical protein n=1 Tax=Streptomyces sp. NBC_00237 TaxID=2975687 RepID=UPI002250F906|nr:hypothetical protein [Streptomyces sp. NBC_00237]MCX5202509.1 hypothetical protein [Streptomyces sp. NBC_00237]
MPIQLIPILVAETAYAIICVFYGARPGASMWLRWPLIVWARMAYGPPPAKPLPRPNYAKILQLERELGMSDEQPMRAEKVCLVKGCRDEDVLEFRSWTGTLLVRVHEH